MDAVTADNLPVCTCDHDFYDGTGINFHLPRCPKGEVIRSVDRILNDASWATGSPLLRLRIYGGTYEEAWVWDWEGYGGFDPSRANPGVIG